MSSSGSDSSGRVLEIARRVAAAPRAERRAVLDAECGEDRVLRSRVEMMLLKQDQMVTLLGPAMADEWDTPADASTDAPGADDAERGSSGPGEPLKGEPSGAASAVEGDLPRTIGRYRVLRVLGEGGMGIVYLAEQDRPKRTVALKVIRASLMTPRLLRRFEHEAEVLARLNHPGIASIYEASSVPASGGGHGFTRAQPFFAMELVQGESLTRHAQQRGLGVGERLDLFLGVCDAVQHAHQKGVIHRDLKPGNILVNEQGKTKVLDFGIARVAEDTDRGSTMRTEAGTLVGTLSYMSPEQVQDPGSVDIRSDVYTMGVILYELLSGRLPHALETHTLPEAVRIIAESEAPSLRSVDRAIPGELSLVVGKAMEKDRSRRYQSITELAADLQRFQRDEPVLARPPSRAYRARKFVRRNRALVTGGSLAVVALVAGIVGTTYQAAEATRGRRLAEERGVELERQREIARLEARTARGANEFLNSMLAAASPESQSSGQITVRELLDDAAENLGRREVEPRVELPLRVTFSNTYRALGRPADALREAERAHVLAKAEFGPDSPDELEARRTLAVAMGDNQRAAEAEALVRSALEIYRADPERWELELVQARAELGKYLVELGRSEEAIEELRAGASGLRTLVARSDRNLQSATHNYAVALLSAGRLEESEQALREALVICEEQFGPEHLATAYELNTLGNVQQRLGRNEDAIATHQRSLAIRRKRLADGHPSILTSMANLAACYIAVGRYDEAIASLRETVSMQEKVMGAEHPKTLSALSNLAFALEDVGRLDEAESTLRRVVAVQRAKGLSDPESFGQLNNLAALLVRRERAVEAEPVYRELFAAAEGRLPPTHPARAIFRNNFGECLAALRSFELAEKELLESHAQIEAIFKPTHERTQKSRSRLASMYEAWGKPERAAAWK